MSVRRWGATTFAAYLDDGGPFGRFVGTASSIEDAERLVVEHEHSDASSTDEHAFVGELGGPAGCETPPDLKPQHPSQRTERPSTMVTHPPDDRWSTLPRMLREPCEGPHGGTSEAVYALDLPNGVRMWLCPSCWVDSWRRHGCPPQSSDSRPSTGGTQ